MLEHRKHTYLNSIYISDKVVKCLPKEKTSRMEMGKPVAEKDHKLETIQRKGFNRTISMNELLANATKFGSRADFWHISKRTAIAAQSILKRRLKPSQKYLRKMLLKRES